MPYRDENIRQKWSRRFQEALAEPPAPAVGAPDEAWSVPPGPASEEPAALWRAPTHDYAADARRLEEELRRQQDRVAEAREAQRRAEAALAELRAQYSEAEGRIRALTVSLEEARARTIPPQDAALAETVRRLEKERDEARRALAEKEDAEQARAGASEAFARELKKRDEELQELRRADQSRSQELSALQARLAAGEAERTAAFEKRLAEREAAFRKDWQEQEQAQEALRKNLRHKETELKLLAENTNRLSQQNKELVTKLQAFKDTPPVAAQAAVAAPDPSLLEKIGSLEVALEGRDRMLADQEKALESQRGQIEQLSMDLKGMQESKNLAQNLTFRVQALMQEKDKLEQAAKSDPSAAEKRKLEELLAARDKELSELKKAVAAAEADKKALAERTIPAAQAAPPEELAALRKQVEDLKRKNEELAARSVAPPAPPAAQEAEALRKQIAELKAKNEDLETQVRLVVMNSEAIERMEKGLRESLRQMALTPSAPPAATRRSFSEFVSGPGLFARLWGWWRAPLLRISRKKTAAPAAPTAAAPAPGGVPPGVERLRQMRQKR